MVRTVRKAGRKAAKVKPTAETSPVVESKLRKIMAQRLDVIEKKQGLIAGANLQATNRQSSGLLVNDLILGGGYVPAMYAYSGLEGSGKSTLSMTACAQAVRDNVSVGQYFDAEGSVDPRLTSNIFRVKRLSEIFGLRNRKNWAVEPKVRYYQEEGIETFFDTIASVLNQLPNKLYLPEEETWAYSFDGKRASLAMMNELELKPDKALTAAYGRRICPTDDSSLQGFIIVDSWPALLLRDVDEAEEARNDMAIDARAFSKHLKRVVGKLRRKAVVLNGVNQIRLRPAVRYGNPEYEPGGEALKFYSSARNQIRARSCPPGWGKGPAGEEASVQREGGTDTYHYKFIQNTKNKTAQPRLGGWSRVWVSDAYGKPQGFDPVFDCYQYLLMTNQLSGNVKKFTVKVGQLTNTQLTWGQFKTLVLAEHFNSLALLKEFKLATKVGKPPRLRAHCFAQLRSGEFADLYNAEDGEFEEVDDSEDVEEDDE